MSLTQTEADALLALEKRFVDKSVLVLGSIAIHETRELISTDGREKFLLDIHRGRINLKKYTLNHRGRIVYA